MSVYMYIQMCILWGDTQTSHVTPRNVGLFFPHDINRLSVQGICISGGDAQFEQRGEGEYKRSFMKIQNSKVKNNEWNAIFVLDASAHVCVCCSVIQCVLQCDAVCVAVCVALCVGVLLCMHCLL